MKRLLSALAVSTLVAGLASTPAQAGLNVGASFTDTEVEDGGFKADDNNYKVFAGWRFFERQWFGIEGQYVDFGDFSSGGTSAEATGFGAFALVSVKVWRFDLFAKAGVASWDTEVSNQPGDDGTDPAYGVGAAFRITERFWVRAEWERFEFDNADADMASLGAELRF
jgi:hypothetical protein